MSSRVPIAGAIAYSGDGGFAPTGPRAGGVRAVCATVSGMRTKYILLLSAACCMPIVAGGALAAPQSFESRVAAQNALVEEYYQSELKAHPERATAYGDYRYNDRLDEYSIAALAGQHANDQSFLARLEAIPTNGFPEQDALSHEVLRNTLRQRLENYSFKEYEMPVNQMEGPHLRLADLPLAVPFDSVKQYEDYIARLHQIPRVFDQTEEVLRAGARDQLMPGGGRSGPFPVAHQEISFHDFPARTVAADPSDHGRGDARSIAGLQGVCRFHRGGLRTPRKNHAQCRLTARRQGALPQRHPQPHHRQQSHSRPDSPYRPQGDRPHSGRHAEHRAQVGLR